jgi:septin 3/9/12
MLSSGQTGLGKSTLINTIFASHLVESKGRLVPNEPVRSTTEIHPVTHIIEENGVRLRLNIVDTPGYGDLVNNDRCWDPIVKYIKDQHSAYLRKELTAQRERYIQDTRIHCCLYFITPTGHSLKPIDIVVLKKLSETVNVVPVIAKADSLTLEERQLFKDRIKEEFAFHNIRMYPYENEEYDSEEAALNSQIKVREKMRYHIHLACAEQGKILKLITCVYVVYHPLRRRRQRAQHQRRRQDCSRPPEPMGNHQR